MHRRTGHQHTLAPSIHVAPALWQPACDGAQGQNHCTQAVHGQLGTVQCSPGELSEAVQPVPLAQTAHCCVLSNRAVARLAAANKNKPLKTINASPWPTRALLTSPRQQRPVAAVPLRRYSHTMPPLPRCSTRVFSGVAPASHIAPVTAALQNFSTKPAAMPCHNNGAQGCAAKKSSPGNLNSSTMQQFCRRQTATPCDPVLLLLATHAGVPRQLRAR